MRGITRSNDLEALQLDLHYVNSSGFVAGIFVSNTQIDPYERRDAELNGYAGFSWSAAGDWHGRILGAYYAYPWNADGSSYNYGEFDLDIGYQDWVDVVLSYSPDARRYSQRDLVGVSAGSVELNLQHRVVGNLSVTGGIGYYVATGSTGADYLYWSAGAAYDLAPVSLSVAYVDTTAGAKTLFYDNAASGRWTGTVIWRF